MGLSRPCEATAARAGAGAAAPSCAGGRSRASAIHPRRQHHFHDNNQQKALGTGCPARDEPGPGDNAERGHPGKGGGHPEHPIPVAAELGDGEGGEGMGREEKAKVWGGRGGPRKLSGGAHTYSLAVWVPSLHRGPRRPLPQRGERALSSGRAATGAPRGSVVPVVVVEKEEEEEEEEAPEEVAALSRVMEKRGSPGSRARRGEARQERRGGEGLPGGVPGGLPCGAEDGGASPRCSPAPCLRTSFM